MADLSPSARQNGCAACKGTGENRGRRCTICGGTGTVPSARRRLLIWLLTPFFLAGEWWYRYTERLADEREARRG